MAQSCQDNDIGGAPFKKYIAILKYCVGATLKIQLNEHM